MNSGLLLLFAAALYTTGCVNAETITVNDAKKTVTAAWNLYVGVDITKEFHTATVKLESGTNVVVKCIVRNVRLDCQLPRGQYLLPKSMADEVGNWFLRTTPTQSGGSKRYYEPKVKAYDLGMYANLYYNSGFDAFNYHLAIEEDKAAEKSNFKLLRMLLSRMLQ